MIIKVINTTSSDIFLQDVGAIIPANNTFTVDPVQYPYWANSTDIVNYVINNILIINDGDSNLPNRVGLGLLQNDDKILTEHYTLVQDDGILIGNGQILQLHDDKWELEDVGEEEDNPTEN
jgi:hypothetical protein